MPSPWLLIIWIPLLAGVIWLLALVPVWGWLFIVLPIMALFYLPYHYTKRIKAHLAERRREQAIQSAIAAMSTCERAMWFNREGPYQDARCIPRETPFTVMTEKERYRYNNAIGEFFAEEYKPAASLFYD